MVDIKGEQQSNIMAGSSPAYPEHPGEPDCAYYMRHGVCGYGNHCRFNHPPASARPLQSADQVGSTGHRPERAGQPNCQHYLRTGDCKYGSSCRYHHPCERTGSSKEEFRLNLCGLPMRLGVGECSHYARTGLCKFGLNCKFHHPQPAGAAGAAVVPMCTSRPVYTLGAYHPSIPLPTKPYATARGSYLPDLQIPAPSSYTPVILSPQWGFRGPISPVTPLDGMEQSPAASKNTVQRTEYAITRANNGKQPATHKDEFPEREGQPDCKYYLKTGDCRFGSVCKFNHPKDWTPLASPSACSLSIIGLPLRPGEPQCSFYLRYGICKFGPVCKFDHPILLPYYSINSIGNRPAAHNMATGVRIGLSESMINSLSETVIGPMSAEEVGSKRMTQSLKEQSNHNDEAADVALSESGKADSKKDGDELKAPEESEL